MSGYGAPPASSGASRIAPVADDVAAGYHTWVLSVRDAAPTKVPFGGVGRVASTNCSLWNPTPCGPRAAKSAVDAPHHAGVGPTTATTSATAKRRTMAICEPRALGGA